MAHTLDLGEGGSVARRRTEILADGSYLFADALDVAGELTAAVVTAEAWLLELYDLDRGAVELVTGAGRGASAKRFSGVERVGPSTRRFGVLYAPFSIVQPRFDGAKGRLWGIASTRALPDDLAREPILFETGFAGAPAGADEAIAIATAGLDRCSAARGGGASIVSIRAKRLFDACFPDGLPVAEAARRLGVSASHLSRQFTRDYGLGPRAYVHRLRVADAPLRLASGERIVDVSAESGYGDLGRFYVQFRKATTTAPGACAKEGIKKRQDRASIARDNGSR